MILPTNRDADRLRAMDRWQRNVRAGPGIHIANDSSGGITISTDNGSGRRTRQIEPYVVSVKNASEDEAIEELSVVGFAGTADQNLSNSFGLPVVDSADLTSDRVVGLQFGLAAYKIPPGQTGEVWIGGVHLAKIHMPVSAGRYAHPIPGRTYLKGSRWGTHRILSIGAATTVDGGDLAANFCLVERVPHMPIHVSIGVPNPDSDDFYNAAIVSADGIGDSEQCLVFNSFENPTLLPVIGDDVRFLRQTTKCTGRVYAWEDGELDNPRPLVMVDIPPERATMIRITGSSSLGTNQWQYTVKELQLGGSGGLGDVSDLTDSIDAFNTYEREPDISGVANVTGLEPVKTGTEVIGVRYVLNGVPQYRFTYQNRIVTDCP